jgi:plastocyanin domain-containing protein
MPNETKKIAVLALAVLSLAGVTASEAVAAEPRTVEITVTENGFEPTPITVNKGEPVTLVVTRKTDKTCAKHLVLDEEKIKKELPLDQPVKITFTPRKSGELKYGCAMGKMIAGVIKVADGPAAK